MKPWDYGEDNDGWYVMRIRDREQVCYELEEDAAIKINEFANNCEEIYQKSMESIIRKLGRMTRDHSKELNIDDCEQNFRKSMADMVSKFGKLFRKVQ